MQPYGRNADTDGMADGHPREVAVTHRPAGFRFLPTDEELVVYYLRRYVGGQPLPTAFVVPFDVYATDPRNLLRDGQKDAFFFARRSRVTANSNKPSRIAGDPREELQWHAFKKKEAVTSAVDGRGRVPVGIKHSLAFSIRGRKHAGLIMYEFALKSQEFQEVVLCHVKISDRVWLSASNNRAIAGGGCDGNARKKRTAAVALDEQPVTSPSTPSPSGAVGLGPEAVHASDDDDVPLWLWSCICELLSVDDGDGRRKMQRIDAVSRLLVTVNQTATHSSEADAPCRLLLLSVKLLLYLLGEIQHIRKTRDFQYKKSN